MTNIKSIDPIGIHTNSKWLIVAIFVSALASGARTDCPDKTRIAIIMNFKSELCKQMSLKNEFTSKEDGNSVFKLNHTTNERNIEIFFFDSCGYKEETVRIIFKTISWSDLKCLRPPFFLGYIGPEDSENLEAASKITSPLRIPHITRITSILPHVHYFDSDKEFSFLRVIFELINELGWKSFTFKGNVKTVPERNFVQQFVQDLFLKDLCILPPSEVLAPIVYIGDLNNNYLDSINNSTILIVGGHNVEEKLDNIQSTNLILLISDSRKLDLKLTNNINVWDSSLTEFDADYATFISNAISVYKSAFNQLCNNENCDATVDNEKWNDYVAQALSKSNNKDSDEYILKVKEKHKAVRTVGRLIKNNDKIKIKWTDHSSFDHGSVHSDDILEKLKQQAGDKKKEVICMAYSDIFDSNPLNSISSHGSNTKPVSEVTDAEWWTMVCTVTGVGIGMFTVGFFAVYVVYTNIRGPQQNKSFQKSDFDPTSSLRRFGSDKQMNFTNNRHSRAPIGIQRRDSRSSIKSNVSDKSV